MLPIRRRVILIGDAGPRDNYLAGVDDDVSNMRAYLLSPRGGRWLPHEIKEVWYRTKAEILASVRSVEADYLFVYYSGHGSGQLVHTLRGAAWVLECKRWLELSTGERIADRDLINERVPRQLVICDCCRTSLGAKIGGIPEDMEGIAYTEDEANAARRWFDGYIRTSPAGRLIVHSTQNGMEAKDSRDGGKFTLALLGGCLYWPGMGGHAPVGVRALVGYAAEVLKGVQVPEIVFQTGDLRVPLALETPWPGPLAGMDYLPAGDDRGSWEAPQRRPVNGWLVVGVTALGLWLLGRE